MFTDICVLKIKLSFECFIKSSLHTVESSYILLTICQYLLATSEMLHHALFQSPIQGNSDFVSQVWMKVIFKMILLVGQLFIFQPQIQYAGLCFLNISRWNQPACPSMRPWSLSSTIRHTSASVRPRDAAGRRTSTPAWHSGPSERPLSFWWSASARLSCWEASSLTGRPLQHVLDRNSLWALGSD